MKSFESIVSGYHLVIWNFRRSLSKPYLDSPVEVEPESTFISASLLSFTSLPLSIKAGRHFS